MSLRVRGAASLIEDLSPRRRELLELLAKGLTNDEIARALTISPGTVRSHVTALLRALDVTNRTEAASMFVAWEAEPAQVAAVLQRPAIAVLPLLSTTDDVRTRNVAGGITEDLAALFSRWCWFPVIATSSTVGARSVGTTPCELGAALHARFLVDGSVRFTGERLRISVHVDDVESGHRLWTDRRDVTAESLFAVQDELCQHMVAAAYPVLISRTQASMPHGPPTTQLAAWELAYRGMSLRAAREPDANAAAMSCFRDALAREPHLVLAHYGFGLAAYDAVLNQWGPRDEAIALLRSCAERCLDHAPHAGEGHYLFGRWLQTCGQWDRAVAPLEIAIGHNPSFALAHAALAQSLQVTGRADEAMMRMQHAARLGPRSFVVGLATLHFMLGQYPEALAEAEQALATTPRYAFARALAAASAHWLGDLERGRQHVRLLVDCSPPFDPTRFRRTFGLEVDAVERLTHAVSALAASR